MQNCGATSCLETKVSATFPTSHGQLLSCDICCLDQILAGADAGFPKRGYLLTTEMRCIRVHARNVLPLFMKFWGPPKVCVGGGGVGVFF